MTPTHRHLDPERRPEADANGAIAGPRTISMRRGAPPGVQHS
jgi:hypothetical protein